MSGLEVVSSKFNSLRLMVGNPLIALISGDKGPVMSGS